LITTAHQRCLMSLAVSDKRIPEWLSISCSLQDWGMAVERPHVWCEVRSFVSQQLSALAHAWHAGNKSRQQLDRCLAATILSSKTSQLFSSFTFNVHTIDNRILNFLDSVLWPWLHENHTSAPQPADTDWVWNWHAGTYLWETSEGRQWAEAACDWYVVSNQQGSLIKRLISGKINACLKVKSKHFKHLLWCVFP